MLCNVCLTRWKGWGFNGQDAIATADDEASIASTQPDKACLRFVASAIAGPGIVCGPGAIKRCIVVIPAMLLLGGAQ